MASNQAQAGGYDCQWVTAPSDELKCLICLCVARDPHQHPGDSENECGKIFCFSCITEHQKNAQNCPNCRQKLTLFKDARGARYIRALKVKCDNLDNGCQWKGELGELEKHLKSCDHVFLPCTNECNNNDQIARILRKDLQDHLNNRCLRRQYQCPHCEEMGEYQERITSHLETCPNVKVPCPNAQCPASTPRCKLSTHRSTCEHEPMSCKYIEVGCKERPLRKDLKKHEEDALFHLQMTSSKVLELTKKVVELSKLQSKLNVTPVIIKLTTFLKHKTNKSLFYSSPFYTSRSGYKMHVRVNVSGWGGGEGTHVSVGAYLMKGDNDDSLTWPFTGTVTFELLNQLEDKNHHKKSVTFPADDKAGKRLVEDERSAGYGVLKYISYTALNHQPNKNCQYLLDDTLIFRVSVQIANPHLKPWLVCTD